jgi:hypothetical protein
VGGQYRAHERVNEMPVTCTLVCIEASRNPVSKLIVRVWKVRAEQTHYCFKITDSPGVVMRIWNAKTLRTFASS